MFRFGVLNLGRVLVLAELVSGGGISAGTLSALTAASKCGDITAFVAAKNASQAGKQLASLKGVQQVLVTDAEHYQDMLAEELDDILSEEVKRGGYTHVLGGHTATFRDIIPRVAAHFGSMPITDIIGVNSDHEFIRQCYAGNVICTLNDNAKVKFLTVRVSAFEKCLKDDSSAEIKQIEALPVKGRSKLIENITSNTDKIDLSSARVVVSGGRGLKAKENFKIVTDIADALGGAVGATRAIVDSGFVPNEIQIGQTGKNVAPDLYLALGISGAIQHTAGMKDSKVIACINSDPDAPLFQIATYGLKADLFDACPKLLQLIKEGK